MKYRITGFLVIASLAIIFLPPLIGRNYIVEKPIEVHVPVAPKLTQDVPQVDVTKILEQAESKATPDTKFEQEIKASDQVAWVLQVGSFKKILNANTLVVELKKSGYKSYMLKYGETPGVLYRVMVGPDLSRDVIQQLQVKIRKEKGLSGIVMKYHPLLQAGVADELD